MLEVTEEIPNFHADAEEFLLKTMLESPYGFDSLLEEVFERVVQGFVETSVRLWIRDRSDLRHPFSKVVE